MDYRKCAQEIYDTVGKRENLVSAAHCATRLRLVTKDNSKVDMKVLEDIDGVKGVFSSNGQLQIIIGTGTVNKVYDEFLDISGMTAATKDDVKAAAAASQPLPKRMVKALGDVFVPILPAIVASGLMMGLVEALGNAIPTFADTGWYSFLDMISGTAFSYLPVLVAISAARVFGGNLFLGAVIGLAMIHSNLINAWSVAGMASSDIPVWNLLNITIGGFTWGNVRAVGYQGHVIPVIIAVYFMCWLEKQLHKIVPEVIDLFVTPLVTVLVTTFLTFTTIGPVFSTLETYVLSFASWLITLPFGLGALVMGAIYPLTVVCGIHHMYNVIEAGLLSEGSLNIWMPIASAANFAQCGACLAVALKTKKAKNRTIAIPSALSASLGITEPAIFGVNLRYMRPLICGMIGGAIGAAFGTIMNIGANAYGVTGIPGFLIVDSHYILPYAILLLISGGIAFALCFAVFRDEEDEPAKKEPASPAIETESNTVYCPVEGNVIARADIPDATFASGALGDGVGIEPTTGVVVAPFDGTISTVAETKHAVGISSNDGLEMLIHVGIDTVAMNGKGFEPQVAEGDTVKAGQVLLRFSMDEIRKAGYSTTTAVLICNADEFDTFQVEKTGPAKQMEKLVVCK
ncbi:MAG: glucose PTS transporter subunit IIA [Clostridiales bacterium]|nr:glucose PTS transporter subunit IIA [Clostridiales bacterium]